MYQNRELVRDNALKVRFSDRDLQRLSEEAEQAGMQLSTYVYYRTMGLPITNNLQRETA